MAARAGYRLTPAARADLEEIWSYTAGRWSPAQADRYVEGLTHTFDLIADMPGIAALRPEFRPPVRIHRNSAHLVVYRDEADHVLIVRILGARQNWSALLGDG